MCPIAVHFEIAHEFDIPLDAIELAVLSPTWSTARAIALAEHRDGQPDGRTSSTTACSSASGATGEREAPDFAKPYVTREMLRWDERRPTT